jgi:hypothetical protein
VPEINCYVPIKLRISGWVDDELLDRLERQLVPLIGARLALAERTLAGPGGHVGVGDREAVREGFRDAGYEARTDRYRIPSYQGPGDPVTVPLAPVSSPLWQDQPTQSIPAPPAPLPSQFPAWSRGTTNGAIPGDPVPGYEQPRASYTQRDWEAMWDALARREQRNNGSASTFAGCVASAMVELWGKHVSAAMAKVAEHASWAFWEELLAFVATQAVTIAVATFFTPAAAAMFEANLVNASKKAVHKVVEIAMGVTTSAAEGAATGRLQEHTTQSAIEAGKSTLDRLTEHISKLTATMVTEIGEAPPDVMPYAHWLALVGTAHTYRDLVHFRLPPLLPDVKPEVIRPIVAGVIIGELARVSESEHPPNQEEPDIAHYHGELPTGLKLVGGAKGTYEEIYGPPRRFSDGEITVGGRDLNDAVFRSPWKDLQAAIIQKVPIREVPSIPLIVHVSDARAKYGGDAVAAARLVTALRRPGAGVTSAAPVYPMGVTSQTGSNEAMEFLRAYNASNAVGWSPSEMVVSRDYAGAIEVRGGSLADFLYLYLWATADDGFDDLAAKVAASVKERRQAWGTPPAEVDLSAIPVAELALEAGSYVDREWTQVQGAYALIKGHIEDLVPRPPDGEH